MLNLFKKGNTSIDYVIAGLGNPGKEYDKTRHNIGFMAIDVICEIYNITLSKSKFDGKYAIETINGKKVLIIKPQTYMNLSGECLEKVLSFYKLKPENMIVIYDDISLDVGKIRIRTKGSAGGHNGIKNIINMTQTNVFPRIKIGVGKKPENIPDLKDYVLSRFKSDELKTYDKVLGDVCNACFDMMELPMQKVMNKYN